MTNYSIEYACFLILWFIVTVLLLIAFSAVRRWLYNRRIRKMRQSAYIAYIEKENKKLQSSVDFYRLQADLGGGTDVSL